VYCYARSITILYDIAIHYDMIRIIESRGLMMNKRKYRKGKMDESIDMYWIDYIIMLGCIMDDFIIVL